MRFAAAITLLLAVTACNQGNSQNVMSSGGGNTLQPADINLALGPEITNTAEPNTAANETNMTGKARNKAAPAAANNATE
jgi:hypothetical protein